MVKHQSGTAAPTAYSPPTINGVSSGGNLSIAALDGRDGDVLIQSYPDMRANDFVRISVPLEGGSDYTNIYAVRGSGNEIIVLPIAREILQRHLGKRITVRAEARRGANEIVCYPEADFGITE